MLKTWLKPTDPIPTWRALGEALRAPAINEVELAKQGIILPLAIPIYIQ